jgi:hypothetical protein
LVFILRLQNASHLQSLRGKAAAPTMRWTVGAAASSDDLFPGMSHFYLGNNRFKGYYNIKKKVGGTNE